MAPLSPQLAGNPLPGSPRSSSGSQRPSIMKRHSSSGQVMTRATIRSPGSEAEWQPLRHAVRPKGHARVVLPRNHSSGRNLAKLARQAAAAAGEAGTPKLHARTRSHEGDTEIRLPGSLDESEAGLLQPPPIKRNLTSYNLPRNSSHTKLKKNYSHGQLQRLGTAKDLAPLTSTKAKVPPSPGLKGKSRRPKSIDWSLDKDLHEREVELAQQQQQEKQEKREGPKKVGFRVGSAGDADADNDQDDEAGQVRNMEGSGLDEGDWTEESASVSPFRTRANTATNSRRPSTHDRVSDRSSLTEVSHVREEPDAHTAVAVQQESDIEADGTPANSHKSNGTISQATTATVDDDIVTKTMQQPVQAQSPAIARSPLYAAAAAAAKAHPNPTAQLLRRNSNQLPAPALVSNITAVDDARGLKASPAASLRSSQSNTAIDQESDELVSRFIPSTSMGSGTTTNMQNTPKTGSFHTPIQEHLAGHREKNGRFGVGPVSPGSTVSGSSGAATPALGRSRIELKMLQEKALADMETAAERGPIVPAHVYDRRNESLKSYLQLAALSQSGSGLTAMNTPLSLGPEIFQGRFKAVNTELRVVQKFRSPMAESAARLYASRGGKPGAKQASLKSAGLRTSKSAVTLPIHRGPPKKDSSNLSTSTSPPRIAEAPAAVATKPLMTASKSSLVIKPHRRSASRGVSFAGMLDESEDVEREPVQLSLNDVAREMWDSVLV